MLAQRGQLRNKTDSYLPSLGKHQVKQILSCPSWANSTRAASNRKQLLFGYRYVRDARPCASKCASTVQYYYSTTFFIAVMAARSSAPQISIE
jgi:hypothetical protein